MFSLENFRQTCVTGRLIQTPLIFAETELLLNCKWLLWTAVKGERCMDWTALDQMFSVRI